ncbi:MAG: alpha/beta hydrolase [Propionibacteriaceae bacterium]|nr:alpha/beta hydrolase [Propionibacteriaceae bacterium]
MSSQHDRLDPESRTVLEAFLDALPGGFNGIPDIVARREASAALNAAGVEAAGGPDPSVTRTDRTAPGLDGDPEVPVRVYRPADAPADATLPGIFFIHGGGMVMGSVEGEDAMATTYAREIGAVVVSTGYRKAPEDPHPAQSRDCWAGLQWMAAHADELGYDPDHLVIMGGSAGGNLALATALRARDEGGPALELILAAYPMLDPSNTTPASQSVTEIGVWDRAGNVEAWEWFLAGKEPDKYASPLLETDWSGLAPIFIDVGTEDLFRDEDITLVAELAAQGNPVEFHLYPGAFHGSEVLAPQAALSQRIMANRLDAVRRAVAE